MYQSIWYHTKLPQSMVDIVYEELKNIEIENSLTQATVGAVGNIPWEDVKKVRNNKISWTYPNSWISGFCYNYVLQANLTNFNFDIHGFNGQQMQYTVYNEGEYYGWHVDDEIGDPATFDGLKRKLSFSLQLSDPKEYDGGTMQIRSFQDKLYEVPKERGVIVVFDSRARHRVMKIKSGCRKSLVGWVGGPRWK